MPRASYLNLAACLGDIYSNIVCRMLLELEWDLVSIANKTIIHRGYEIIINS